MLTTIASVLKQKDHQVWSVAPAASVSDAMDMMALRRCLVLLVMSGEALVGIVSERDCTRKRRAAGKKPADVQVSAIMTSKSSS